MIALLGKHRELRQLRQSDVHSEGRALALPVMHPRMDVCVDRALRNEAVEQELRIDAGDDGICTPRLASGDDARRFALVDDDLLDRRAEQDVDALLARRSGHRLGDRAHPADRMAPGAGNSGGLAEQVVEQDVGAARRVGRCEIADDPVEPEQSLGEVALKIAVEDLARAPSDEVVDDANVGGRQPDHVLAERQQAPAARAGRRQLPAGHGGSIS